MLGESIDYSRQGQLALRIRPSSRASIVAISTAAPGPNQSPAPGTPPPATPAPTTAPKK